MPPVAKTVPRDLDKVSSPWVLVLGGISREGNRRARRNCVAALETGMDVVWFDGFEERHPRTGDSVPLSGVPSERSLVIIGYRERQAASLSGRLIAGHSLRRRKATRWLWKKATRRLGRALQGRSAWLATRPLMKPLTRKDAPAQIVYCDNVALTTAWYCARIWEETPVAMSFSAEL